MESVVQGGERDSRQDLSAAYRRASSEPQCDMQRDGQVGQVFRLDPWHSCSLSAVAYLGRLDGASVALAHGLWLALVVDFGPI